MPREPIPPERLEPLLRGGWQGATRAWTVLLVHRDAIRAAVVSVWRTLDVRTDETLEDLTSETLTSIMGRASADEGLARPDDWAERADAFPWLFRVVRSHAETAARRLRRTARTEVPAEREDGTRPPRTEPRAASDPEEELARARSSARLQALLVNPDLKPAHKLVLVLRFFPQHLSADLVARVYGASDPSHGSGLARTPDETAMLLRRWVDERPREDVAANRELAWILRSTDRTGPEAWRRAHPDDMARALDLVRQWRNRALKHMGGDE